MEDETTPSRGTLEIYLRLIDTINEHQSRLAWSELFFIALEVVIFFACATQVIRFDDHPVQSVGIGSATILTSLAIGIAVSTYWMAHAMRLQLRLKLRYFQARYLERRLGGLGEDILTGDARFNKDMTELESPDGEETIVFPRKGALRTDGFFGAAKPRVLSVLMPGLFFMIFMTLFIWVLVAFLAAAR